MFGLAVDVDNVFDENAAFVYIIGTNVNLMWSLLQVSVVFRRRNMSSLRAPCGALFCGFGGDEIGI